VAPAVESPDFNGDGVVDGADFLTWQLGVGAQSATLGQGDANGDMMVDGYDLAAWQEQYGGSDIVGASAVPEPTAMLLGGLSMLVVCRRRL
jgi:hypothetical protein